MVIAAQRVGNIRDLLGNRQLISVGIGPKGELLLLCSDKTYWDAKTHTFDPGPFLHHVYSFHSEEWRIEVSFGPVHRLYTFVQPLPSARWLVVDARAHPDNQNASVLDNKGHVLYSFAAGDGIEHVQINDIGEIWIGYFDEGVFGGGQLSHSGLVCLDESGNALMRFWEDVAEPNQLPPIDDCYALNVKDRDVWVSYYSAFPLVKLQSKSLSAAWLEGPRRPARSLAVAGDTLLIVPAYKKEGPFQLVDTKQAIYRDVQVHDPEGRPFRFESSCGRGSILCFISDRDEPSLYLVDIGTQAVRS